MGYQLRQDVAAAWVDDEIVFLDLVDDRYYLAPPALKTALREEIGSNGDKHVAGLEPLVRRGLLVPTDIAGVSINLAQAAVRPTSEAPQVAPPIILIFSAIAEQLRVAVALRLCPLRAVIAEVQRRKRSAAEHGRRPGRNGDNRAAAFRAASKYLSSDSQCLRRSVALANQLLARHDDVQLVFGVCLRPFGAHCWVQRGDVVLNDTLESVRRFTPVLAV
jgi:hypothetical protein